MIFDSPLSVLRLFLWRRSTGLEHLLQHLEPHPCLGLVLTDCQVVRQVRVAHQTGKCVPGKVASRLVSRSKVRLSPVLVSCPLKLGGVGMTCAHVLGLQMLHLREDVEPACAVCSRHFDK